ncbi:MAG: hypothetical protein JSS02_20230 [Planctomycetes bacterium]|nr:hypothetical protein [Planctomycetota bacterium]
MNQPRQETTGSSTSRSKISMQAFSRRQFLETSLVAAGAYLVAPQFARADVLPGLETVAAPLILGEEKGAQPDLWVMEVRFKPVRMVQVPLTDPKTGKTSKDLVWYLAYRAVIRNTSGISDSIAKKDRPMFVPELTLVAETKKGPVSYTDSVIPAAQKTILKRERHEYKNSVEIVGPIPKITADGSKTLTSLDGLATWTGIDPDVVFFKIYFTGFSNGYKITAGPNGEEIVTRRCLEQAFWRPGDRFDQNEEEIRLKGEPKWVYR